MTLWRKWGKRTPDAIKDQIRRLAADGWGATDIHRRLPKEDAPSVRTIRAVLSEQEGTDRRPWRMIEAEPDDVPLVLPVLAYTIEQRQSRSLSVSEAEWVVRIRRAAPDLSPRLVLWLAVGGELAATFPDVQTIMAFEPWRDKGARFFSAFGRENFSEWDIENLFSGLTEGER